MTAFDKFLDTLEDKKVKEVIEPLNYQEFLKLPHIEKVGRHHYGSTMYYRKDKTGIYCAYFSTVIHRAGKRFYPKTEKTSEIFITNKNFIFKNPNDILLEYFFKQIDSLWKPINKFSGVELKFFTKTRIFKNILLGKIYNDETFYRAIGKYCYQIKNFNWRDLKFFLNQNVYFPISVYDLKDYTVNLENSLRIYNSKEADLNLLNDLIHYAALLDKPVNLAWSRKRMEREHQKQIEEYNLLTISSKSDKPIYNNFPETETFHLLNTEQDLYREGCCMHHCIYSYYGQIKSHGYLAYHITSPEDCTMGLILSGDKVIIDQIYLKYDQQVSNETRQYAEDFVKVHQKELFNLFDNTFLPLTPRPIEGTIIQR